MDQAVIFGQHQNLVGVATQPNDYAMDVAAILLTPGMLHNAGPFRLHTELARALAELKIQSLRFDLSGIGESLAVGSTGRSIDRAAHETGQAMDFMQREFGIKKFVLFGLCSGADDSVQTALQDERVIGFAIMDGCGYKTRAYRWHRIKNHVLPRLLMREKWVNVVRRSIGIGTGLNAPSQLATDVREFPSREVAAQDFQELVNRGLHMHFVYTGGIAEYYNYERQFLDMFYDVDWKDLATTTFFPRMDHVGLLCEDRDLLVKDITNRIRQMAESNCYHSGAIETSELPAPVILPFNSAIACDSTAGN